jgi:putative N6-adenine-specific DNA methylase
MTDHLPDRLLLFAGCAPGLEPFLFRELKQLNVGNATMEAGGVSFTGGPDTMARINLQSRIADRILVRIGRFSAPHLSSLQKAVADLSFTPYVAAQSHVVVNGVCKKSRIYHSGAAAERLARAIARQVPLRRPPACQQAPNHSEENTVAFQLRIIRDEVTVSVDTSGDHLHRRGYRTHVKEAPLRETVAAAALQFCDYTGEFPLINPMCGSGTLAIEGALMAGRISPGLQRRFAFEHWPSFRSEILNSEKERAHRFSRGSDTLIHASDISSSALDAAIHNARTAGFKDRISFEETEISNLTLPQTPGLCIVNPPWGKRMAAVQFLYRQIGDLKKHHPDWQLCVIASDHKQALETGIDFVNISAAIPMGGVRIRFYLG